MSGEPGTYTLNSTPAAHDNVHTAYDDRSFSQPCPARRGQRVSSYHPVDNIETFRQELSVSKNNLNRITVKKVNVRPLRPAPPSASSSHTLSPIHLQLSRARPHVQHR